MTNNITIVSFDPLITMALIGRKQLTDIIKAAIKAAIEDVEKNHRAYTLDDLLDDNDE